VDSIIQTSLVSPNDQLFVSSFNPLSPQLPLQNTGLGSTPDIEIKKFAIASLAPNSGAIDFNPHAYIEPIPTDNFLTGSSTIYSLTFQGTDDGDKLYFTVNGNTLSFSNDGTSYTDILGLQLSAETRIDVNLSSGDDQV
jgi:hypothetical protein